MDQHHLAVSRKAHYYTLGTISERTKRVWIVIHGYGQLAKYFIRKFQPLEAEDTYIVAPEGLSKYYIDEQHKRVGATWMTKENRLDEIDDHINYLNILYKHLISELPEGVTVDINVLGFSQGVATACRWVLNCPYKISRLVLWSGTIPPDLGDDFQGINDFKTDYVYGSNDPYLKNNDLNTEGFKSFNPYVIKTFNGGHEIVKGDLLTVIEGVKK